MSQKIYFILGDQLSLEHPFLKRKSWLSNERLVMIESIPRAEWLPYHPQKLMYLFVCMRRFAQEIRSRFPKISFDYIEESRESFTEVLNSFACDEVHVVEPSEPRARQWIQSGLAAKLIFHPSPFF